MYVSLVRDKGKIVTMEGTKWNRRVNYRTLEELFKIAKETSETFTYDISFSVLEFYNEKIRDILAPPTTSKSFQSVHCRENINTRENFSIEQDSKIALEQ
ncbi:hypothetical protein P3S68_003624 [Capsicum galapagoense]